MGEPHPLPLIPEGSSRAPLRHPEDGWSLAEPFPMGKRTSHILERVADALLPPPPAPRSPEIDRRVVHHAKVMLRYMPRITALGFLALLHLLDLSPLWRLRRFRRLSSLPREDASALLEEVSDSRFLTIRMMMLGPKGLLLSTYFDQDEVHRALGYDPGAFTAGRITLRKRLLAGGSETRADEIHHAEHLG